MEFNYNEIRKEIINLLDEELKSEERATQQNWFKRQLANKIIIKLSKLGIFGGVINFRDEPELSKLVGDKE